MNLKIVPFQPQDQERVKDLILAGLVEHWGYLDASKNPDLVDIQTHYRQATFLVAWLDDRIVGTGALVPRSAEVAEIVRMSVAVDMRRHGIGRAILHQLSTRAQQLGFRRLILETTATWQEVIEFYQRFGFSITHFQNGDVYFYLDLN
ncbi:MAG: GNAT family N-acetyltransferase [Anaerolineae bacterium]